LTHVLTTYHNFDLVGSAETFEVALPIVRRCEVDVVLYDLRCLSGLIGLRRLAIASEVSVLALGVEESVEWVVACAEAGIAGYVTDNTSLDELVTRVEDAARGDFNCPPHIAASLLRRLATIGPFLGSAGVRSRLTPRELEVATLLQEGLSNKQIASRLTIQLATVKNHVHSILEKLETSTRIDAAAVLRSSSVGIPSHKLQERRF
jgi:DNA-binding NarL/FixJ family response regulator